MGDEITTDPNGLAQIRFLDDTKIVVGRNSKLVIDSFVFNPDNTAQRVTVDAVKGFFRFISGNSSSGAYTVRTPTMTIGIRGTTLDIHSHGAGSRAIFHEGSGFGQDAGGQSLDFAAGDCTINVAPTGGGFETPGGLDQRLQLSAYFPFIADQSDLDPAFRADVSSCAVAFQTSPPTPSVGPEPAAPESRFSSNTDVSG